ncbi:restriction endonuclease subunit S [Ferrimonas senticii]|uniref:restriction endonuclease subunit S n=1 Tax=Ferrimonas senticii TaxID=394566 RepID=UPI0003F4F600|nr:restriction endonuclease subunit S [Ferrimonas senticii]
MAWENKKLGDVCRFINGRAYKKSEMLSEGPYPLLRVGNFFTNRSWYYSDLELDADKYCDTGDLLYAWSASFGPRIWDGGKVIYHYHIWKIEPNECAVDKHYLYYLLDWDKEKIKEEQGAGTTMVHVTKGSMEKRILPFAPLKEQKRIVAILDQAFTEIEQARALAEKNLNNARKLFESYLQQVFCQRGEGWVEENFGACFKLKSGVNLTSKQMIPGDYPVYGGNEMAGMHNDFNLSGDNVIIGRVGALCGKARNITTDIWLTDNAFKVVDYQFDFDNRFLTYLLNYKNLRGLARQAAQPVISNSSLNGLKLQFPLEIESQKNIGECLESLSKEVEALSSLYTKKLNFLNELKKSILQHAFSGQLTNKETA